MTNTSETNLPTIVYVEDNDGDSLLLEEALRKMGHQTQLMVIEKGNTALHYFQVKDTAKDVPPPHCILLDNNLPVVSGMELLQFIRGSHNFDGTPVYIFADVSIYKKALDDGHVAKNSFISKPASWSEYLVLADHLMKSAQVNMHKSFHGDPELVPPTKLQP